MKMQKRSSNEKSNQNHDPEYLVSVPVMDSIRGAQDRNGEVEDGNDQ